MWIHLPPQQISVPTCPDWGRPVNMAVDILAMLRVPELQSRIHLTSTGSEPRGKLLSDPLVWSDNSSLTWMIPGGFFSPYFSWEPCLNTDRRGTGWGARDFLASDLSRAVMRFGRPAEPPTYVNMSHCLPVRPTWAQTSVRHSMPPPPLPRRRRN